MEDPMPSNNYPSALANYHVALDRLYAPAASVAADRGVANLAAAPDLDQRAKEVEERSAEFGEAAAAELASPDPERRELAALQLLAGAAADLAVAEDLSRAAGGAVDEAPERDAGGGVPAEVLAILSVPLSAGLRGLALTAPERGVGPSDSRAARAALKEAAEAAVEDIVRDAARAVQVSFVGLSEIPAPPLKEAAGLVIHDLMVKVGEGISFVLRKAVGLVLRAVEKILAALGPAPRAEIRHKVEEWVEALKKGALIEQFLAGLYQVPRIKAEVDTLIGNAASDTTADLFNGTADHVARLAARFEKQRSTIEWVVRGLGWVRPWVVGLQPWGPLALAGAYVGLIGYAVVTGGDYVDWYWTGDGSLLDLVPGVRAVVRENLGRATPS
jgi:hypothetical protein